MRASNFNYLVLGMGIAILAFGGLWTSLAIRKSSEPPSIVHSLDTEATVLSKPMAIPEFSLTDHQGNTFTQDSFRGHWNFLFFGYTHCPDVCPAALATLNQVDQLLKEASTATKPRTIFISVDPERDTVQRLTEYVSYFNPAFIGITGEEPQIQALTKPLGIGFWRVPEQKSEENYLIDHSATILLVNPDNQLQALISPPHRPETIVTDFQKIVKAFGQK